MRSSTMVVAGPRETFQTPATGIAVKQRRAVTGVPAAPVGMGFDDAGHVGLFLQAEGILDRQQHQRCGGMTEKAGGSVHGLLGAQRAQQPSDTTLAAAIATYMGGVAETMDSRATPMRSLARVEQGRGDSVDLIVNSAGNTSSATFTEGQSPSAAVLPAAFPCGWLVFPGRKASSSPFAG